jgi:hypothetical protein
VAETRWRVIDPQNRIRRMSVVEDGTVDVQIVLDGAAITDIQAVQESAAAAGIELEPIAPTAPNAPPAVTVDGVEYAPAG